MQIFEALRLDHDKQRDLIKQLTQTEGKSEQRLSLYEILKQQLNDHAVAEERYFYVPLMKDDMTQEKSRHSIAEHHQLDEFIEQLDSTAMDSPQWLKIAKDLQHKLLHHLEEEEQQVFQLAGKVLSTEQKSELALSYREQMR